LYKPRPRIQQWGFTIIEVLVIVVVAGVLAAAAGPSLTGLFDTIKVNQTVAELRISLQETQRQAIRKNQSCEFALTPNASSHKKKKAKVSGNCLLSGEPDLPEGVSVETNVKPILNAVLPDSLQAAKINFSRLGNAEFNILSAVQLPALPKDPSAKMVAYIPTRKSVQMKCVAVSNTLGLTRIGTYTGDVSPTAITDQGVCTALDWKEQ
jgi:type II secretory pathway pseudopilin PulG